MKNFNAADILDFDNKSVKIGNLKDFADQINSVACWDKVGGEFYMIDEVVHGKEPKPSDFYEVVAEWLKFIDTLTATKQNIGFNYETGE